LTINASSSSSTDVTSCDSYEWNGTVYTTGGSYVFNTTNAAGCDSTATLNLTISTPTTSTTDVTVCANQLPYIWNGTDYTTSGTYVVNTTSAAGCDSTAILNLTVSQTPIISGLRGPKNICSFVGTGVIVTYKLENTIPGVRYSWTVTPGIEILTDLSNNPDSIQVVFNSTIGAGNAQIRVRASDTCNQTSPIFVYYLVSSVLVAPAFSTYPLVNICESISNQTSVTYEIGSLAGADSYTWNFTNTDGSPVTGVTILSPAVSSFADLNQINQNSITIQYDASFTSGILTVAGNNGCGMGDVRTLNISKSQNTVSFEQNSITNVCNILGIANAPGENICYDVVFNGSGATFEWAYPALFHLTGITTSLNGSRSSICGWFEEGYSSGEFTVVATYNCGVASASLSVSATAPLAPTEIVGLTSICDYVLSSGNHTTYSISEVPDATSYTWHVPDGCSINGVLTNELSGAYLTTIDVAFPDGFIGDEITVTANNNCGNSIATLYIEPCNIGGKTTNPVTKVKGLENMNIKVFPNPTTNEFHLNVNTTITNQITVRILDIHGRMMKFIKMMPEETIKFGNDLRSGSYIVEVLQGNKKITQRVIKF
jgi:hypothetical protein